MTRPVKRPLEQTRPRSRVGMYGLLVANIVSLSGTRLSMIALPWFVVVTTGSAAQTGLAAFIQMGPYVVAKMLAGPLVDRIGARKVIVAGEAAGAVAIGLIPLLHYLEALPFWVFLVAVALVGASSGPADGAKTAAIPAVAKQAHVPYERITGLFSAVEGLATTVGAALAGAMVALLGSVPTLILTALTFTTAAVIIATTLRLPHTPSQGGYLTQFTQAVGFVRKDRLLVGLCTMLGATNLLNQALFAVALPIWAAQTGYGPEAVGLLAAVMSGAAVTTSIAASIIGHRLPRRLTYLIGFLISGAPRFLVLAADVPLSVVITVFAVSGLGVGVLNPIITAVTLERLPQSMLGRGSALLSSLAWAGIPFGGIVAGGLISMITLSPALLALGAGYLVATMLPALAPTWKQMDQRPQDNAGTKSQTQSVDRMPS